jgi:hypothetical protein
MQSSKNSPLNPIASAVHTAYLNMVQTNQYLFRVPRLFLVSLITISATSLVRLKENPINAPPFSAQQVKEFNKIE